MSKCLFILSLIQPTLQTSTLLACVKSDYVYQTKGSVKMTETTDRKTEVSSIKSMKI